MNQERFSQKDTKELSHNVDIPLYHAKENGTIAMLSSKGCFYSAYLSSTKFL